MINVLNKLAPLAVVAATAFSACRTSQPESSLAMFNGELVSEQDDDFRKVAKLFYRRGSDGEFSSTAFFLSPRVLITSGHSLAGPTYNFQIAAPNQQRESLAVAQKLVSQDHVGRLDPASAAGALDVGILLLQDANAAQTHELLTPAAWPPAPANTVKIIGTGRNDRNNAWNQAVKIRGKFPLLGTSQVTLSYDMSRAGAPYTATGDSGAPILFEEKVIGVHAGTNVTSGVVSSGFGTSLFSPELATILATLPDEYMNDHITALVARASYLRCTANDMSMQWRMPLFFSRSRNSDTLHAVVVEASDWSRKAPFAVNGMPTALIMQDTPWMKTDRTSDKLRVRMISMNSGACKPGNSIDLALLRQNEFGELNLQFVEEPTGVRITVRPGASDQHIMRLPY